MIGKTFALVRRALMVETREKRSYLFRAALAGCILFFLVTLQRTSLLRSAPGLVLFGSIMMLNYWFITLAGATFFAAAITEEKEERTLGLLRMANIGPLSLLTGKWLPRLIGAALLIAIQIPFAVLAITLGGVLWQQIAAGYLALLAHLVLVGNLGLLFSVIMRRTTSACGATIVALFLYHIGPLILGALASLFRDVGLGFLATFFTDSASFLTSTSALIAMTGTLATGFQSSIITFQMTSNVIGGAIFFLLAWVLFNPLNRSDLESSETNLTQWIRRWSRKDRQRSRVWNEAIVWKDFQYAAGGMVQTVGKIVGYGLLLLLIITLFEGWGSIDLDEFGGMTIGISIAIFILELTLITARLYRTELTEKTWSSLCMLPRSIPEIAYPKLIGAAGALLPAIFWFSFGSLLCLDELFEFFEELLEFDEAFLFVSYFTIMILAGIHFSVWLSISTSWAIWPLAIFISGFAVVMTNMLLLSCLLFSADEEFAFFIMTLVFLAAAVTFHFLIGERLRNAAAE